MQIANSVSPECARLDRNLNRLFRCRKDEIIRNWLWIGDANSVPSTNVRGVINLGDAGPSGDMNIAIEDVATADIASHFNQTGEFIHAHISNNEGVLVRSNAGISRAATICMAYLIKYQGMSLTQAQAFVKDARETICPNDGFNRQLAEYAKINNE